MDETIKPARGQKWHFCPLGTALQSTQALHVFVLRSIPKCHEHLGNS
ncbi:hypothetical protein BIW11_02741 [Tropilaelaps mercedesae]|uniref:Uncharacterized protein n=1 Tax=Tropilaelaps mercedesae TaxID=418985 RepID=A0A1V9XYE3_9ACAR|nr:hypothetical protein BIW11_02741 [Tropilaelaps mercedesae]